MSFPYQVHLPYYLEMCRIFNDLKFNLFSLKYILILSYPVSVFELKVAFIIAVAVVVVVVDDAIVLDHDQHQGADEERGQDLSSHPEQIQYISYICN